MVMGDALSKQSGSRTECPDASEPKLPVLELFQPEPKTGANGVACAEQLFAISAFSGLTHPSTQKGRSRLTVTPEERRFGGWTEAGSNCPHHSIAHLPITRIWNEPGIIGGRGAAHPGRRAGRRSRRIGRDGAGTGPYSAVISRIWPVLVSSVSVLARAGVATVCSTRSWWASLP